LIEEVELEDKTDQENKEEAMVMLVMLKINLNLKNIKNQLKEKFQSVLKKFKFKNKLNLNNHKLLL